MHAYPNNSGTENLATGKGNKLGMVRMTPSKSSPSLNGLSINSSVGHAGMAQNNHSKGNSHQHMPQIGNNGNVQRPNN